MLSKTKERRPSAAMVVAMVALVLGLSGTSYAASKLAAKNSVTSNSIKSGNVKTSDLARSSVTSAKVKDGSLTARDFKRGQLKAGSAGTPGAVGAQGAQGSRGPAGADGARGSDGAAGSAGRTKVVASYKEGKTVASDDDIPVTSVTLGGGGDYLVQAKVNAMNLNGGASDGTCDLYSSADAKVLDYGRATQIPQARPDTIVVQGHVTAPAGGLATIVTLRCDDSPNGAMHYINASVAATLIDDLQLTRP